MRLMKYSTLELRRKGVEDHLVNCYAEVFDKLAMTKNLEEICVLKNKQRKIEKALSNLYGLGF